MVVELERHQVRLVEQVAGHGPAAVEPPARIAGAAGFDESRRRRRLTAIPLTKPSW